ncbi:hypothetical protein [Rhizobium rhizogenes]|jgi:hypothetical protein|uniref:hypothetical protein n=1 Tax=Rhizobium rhizogenes TaxID=359 RepID=UPI0022BB42A6|nr:hypothetical protein [Rhizobium rhizogenes]MCZ7486752.1 hypothetical protein [Rhizobium rhizogenes]
MKKLVIAGAAFLIAAGSSFAQQPPPPPTPGAADAGPRADAPPPPPPGPDGPKHAGWRDGPHGKRMPPPSKAAHFRLEDGERKIDVKCADDEPMKACADIMMQIIDKMNE